MTLIQHLESNWLNYTIIEPDLIFTIKDIGIFLVISPKDGLLFDQSFNLILDDLESELADNVDFFAFQFGGKWYHYGINDEPELKELKYLGHAKKNMIGCKK